MIEIPPTLPPWAVVVLTSHIVPATGRRRAKIVSHFSGTSAESTLRGGGVQIRAGRRVSAQCRRARRIRSMRFKCGHTQSHLASLRLGT